MKTLFWLAVGMGLGAAGYRYYERNGGRLPFVEQLLGGDTDQLVEQATSSLNDLKAKGQKAVNEQVGGATREAVAAVADEIADAERAKRREQARARTA